MIIGLTGYSGSGKDTVGAELISRGGWTRVSFAEPLKKMAFAIDPIVQTKLKTDQSRGDVVTDIRHVRLSEMVRFIGWERAKWECPEVRQFLQRLGQYARVTFGENCWVDIAADEIVEWTSQGINVVITDCRYPNEAEMIRSLDDGYVVFIHRPGVGPVNDHVSDQKLPENLIDAYLSNEGELEHIPARVGAILEHLDLIGKQRKGLATIQEQIQEWMNRPVQLAHEPWPLPAWHEGEVSYKKEDELG